MQTKKELAIEKFRADRFATDTCGIHIDTVEDHHVICSMEIGPGHLNANDVVMGGAIFTLADFAFAVATNQDNVNCVSVSSTIEFLRAAKTKKLYAETQVVKDGKSLCFYDIFVTDDDGKMIAKISEKGYNI